MFGANFLRYAFMVAGGLLLLPAAVAFTSGGPGACRRLCWVYEVTAQLVGSGSANVLHGAVWLALAMAFLITGYRIRPRNGAGRAV